MKGVACFTIFLLSNINYPGMSVGVTSKIYLIYVDLLTL